jgi:hypothetical protein
MGSISIQLFPDTVNSIQFTRKQKEKLPHLSGENLTKKKKVLEMRKYKTF